MLAQIRIEKWLLGLATQMSLGTLAQAVSTAWWGKSSTGVRGVERGGSDYSQILGICWAGAKGKTAAKGKLKGLREEFFQG